MGKGWQAGQTARGARPRQGLSGSSRIIQEIKQIVLVGLASILLPFGWGEVMSTDHALWRICFGWALWAIPAFVFLHILYRWLSDKGILRVLRFACVSLCTLMFVAAATINIHLLSKPNFLYVIPGLVLNDNSTRIFYVLPRGRYPFFAVDLLFTDEDKFKDYLRAGNPTTNIHWEEIDQRSGGFPLSIAARPWKLGHETFTASFQTRDIDVFENLRVETRGYALFPYYYVKITNQRTGELIVECKSRGFPTSDPAIAKSSDCEPLGIGLGPPSTDNLWQKLLKHLW